MNFQEIFNTIKNFFSENYMKIIIFFAILVIGLILIKLILKTIMFFTKKISGQKIIRQFIFHILKFCLYLLLIIILLKYVGIEISGLVTVISALLLAIGLSLQNILSNISNGLVIVSTKMLQKGDYVSINGIEGFVEDVNFVFSTLITYDGKKITIPNNSILNNTVSNFGAGKRKRLEFNFSVAYESDVELVKKIVLDVINSSGRILNEPEPPLCRLNKFGASSIDFFAYCWVDFEDHLDVHYYIMENVYNEFKKNKITIPFMQIEMRERTEKVKFPINKKKITKEKQKVRNKKQKDVSDEYINDLRDYTKRTDIPHIDKLNEKQ